MKVLELPQRPQAIPDSAPPLPPVPVVDSLPGGLRRVADAVLDRVDPVGFGRALGSEAAGLVLSADASGSSATKRICTTR